MLSCCPYACYLYCPSLTFVFLLHIGAQLVLLNSDWWSNWPASQHKGTCWSWSSEKSFLVLPLFTIQSTEGSPYYLLRLFDAHLFKSGLLFWAICCVFQDWNMMPTLLCALLMGNCFSADKNCLSGFLYCLLFILKFMILLLQQPFLAM